MEGDRLVRRRRESRDGRRKSVTWSSEVIDEEKRRRSRSHASLPWYLVLLYVAIILLFSGLSVYLDGIMPEAVSDGLPNQFHASKARSHMEDITSLGIRHVGGKANEVHAKVLLVSKLEEIKKKASPKVNIEISVQTVSGTFFVDFLNGITHIYQNISNVVARISRNGSKAENAFMVNAHYDSALGTVAASDDAISCGIMLEALRCLSNDPDSLHSDNAIIFLFNGAEESVLQASHGFITQHPWASSIRAFLNLEAAGAGGKEIVFQTGPGHPWLARLYSKVVPYPHASVLAQEVFQSGIIPSDTDFRIFRDHGKIPGIDVAYFVNGYVYHTEYDVPSAIPDGSIQRAGENVLALLQAAVQSPHLSDTSLDSHGKNVFFDILGLLGVVYTESVAVVINIAMVMVVFVLMVFDLDWSTTDSSVHTLETRLARHSGSETEEAGIELGIKSNSSASRTNSSTSFDPSASYSSTDPDSSAFGTNFNPNSTASGTYYSNLDSSTSETHSNPNPDSGTLGTISGPNADSSTSKTNSSPGCDDSGICSMRCGPQVHMGHSLGHIRDSTFDVLYSFLSPIVRPTPKQLLAFVGVLGVSWIASVAAALAVGGVLTIAGRSMTWYAEPCLIAPLYVVPALLAMAGVHVAALEKFSESYTLQSIEKSSFLSIQLVWTVCLMILTCLRVCSAFIFLMAVVGHLLFRTILLEKIIAREIPPGHFMHRVAYTLCSACGSGLPGMLLLQVFGKMMQLFVPLMGRSGALLPSDMAIGGLVGILVALLLPYCVCVVVYSSSSRFKKWVGSLALLVFVLTLVAALGGHFKPYSMADPAFPRPKRLFLVHTDRRFHAMDGSISREDTQVFLYPFDYLGLATIAEEVPLFKMAEKVRCEGLYCGQPGFIPVIHLIDCYSLPADHYTNLQAPQVELVAMVKTSEQTKNFSFAVKFPPRSNAVLGLSEGLTLKAWSLESFIPAPNPCPGSYVNRGCYFILQSKGFGDGHFNFWLETQGVAKNSESLRLLMVAHYLDPPESLSPDLERVTKDMPAWVTDIGWAVSMDEWIF